MLFAYHHSRNKKYAGARPTGNVLILLVSGTFSRETGHHCHAGRRHHHVHLCCFPHSTTDRMLGHLGGACESWKLPFITVTADAIGGVQAAEASIVMLPRRVCCNQLCAMPAQHVRDPEQAREMPSPKKNCCDKQVSSWRHISCHTDKNRYYT